MEQGSRYGPPIERKADGTLYEMTPVQQKQAAKIIQKYCSNYDRGISMPEMTATSGRLKEKQAAQDLANVCAQSMAIVSKCERKEKSEKAPALYDLASLQRDANRKLGYTAQQTLDYTQSLYQ